jgi:hypothetical protein
MAKKEEQAPWDSPAAELAPWEAAPWEGGAPGEEAKKEPTLADEAAELGKKGLEMGLRGLNVLGGTARTGLAKGVEALSGKNLGADWKQALRGEAPGSAEFMKRAGVPEGGHLSDIPGVSKLYGSGPVSPWYALSKGGLLDPSARGAAGFVADMATDPLSYVGAGVAGRGGKVAETVDAALNPIRNASESVGTKVYRAGLKKVDQAAEDFGKSPHAASDVLMKNNIWGSMGSVRKQAIEKASELKAAKDAAIQEADRLGARGYAANATQKADQRLSQMLDDPQHDLVKDILPGIEFVERYKAQPAAPLATLDRWKTGLTKKTGPNGYKIDTVVPDGKAMRMDIAGGLKSEIENQANRVKPNLGDEIQQTNADLGPLLTVRKAMRQAQKVEENKNFFTPVDAMLGGMGLMLTHAPDKAIALMAAKKAADLSKSTALRTGLGLGMKKAGSLPLLDPAARELLVQQSPWSLINQQANQKK